MVDKRPTNTYEQAQVWTRENGDQRSLGELLSELSTDVSMLMRKEIQLARVETAQKINAALGNIVGIVVGGAIAYAGALGLVAAAIVALAQIWPLWLAAAAIGLLLVVIGAITIMSAQSSLKHMNVAPERMIESIREDAEMVREKVT